MAEPNNVVLQHLRAIREQLDTLNNRVLELTQRAGTLEVQVAPGPGRTAPRLDRSIRSKSKWQTSP